MIDYICLGVELICVIGCRYLIEKGARLDAVNNDGELAIDLAEGNKMEVLITNAMEKQGNIFIYIARTRVWAQHGSLTCSGLHTFCLRWRRRTHACLMDTFDAFNGKRAGWILKKKT